MSFSSKDMTIADYEALGLIKTNPVTRQRLIIITIAMMLSVFLASLDQTIVSTSIRTIGDDLHGYSMQAWVTTSYFITSTVCTVLYGKLADIYGRRSTYILSIIIFILGSLLCSFSQSMGQLSLARALQGIGGGGIFTLTNTVISDITSPKTFPRVQSFLTGTFAVSGVLGPLLGGLFAGRDYILGIRGWRWVFLVNVPIGLVVLVAVFFFLHSHVPRLEHKVDFVGASALIVSIVPLLLVVEQFRQWGAANVNSILCLVVFLVGLIFFLRTEKARKDSALLPLRIFKNKTFTMGVIINFTIGATLIAGSSLLPQYFQIVRDANPTQAGLLSVPQVIGMLISSVTCGFILSHTGKYRKMVLIGNIITSAVYITYCFLTSDVSIVKILVLSGLIGLGLGAMMQPVLFAVQNSLERSDVSVATSTSTFFRSIGGTLGVAAVLSILFTQFSNIVGREVDSSMQDSQFAAKIVATANSSGGNPQDPNVRFAQGVVNHSNAFTRDFMNNSSIIHELKPEFARPIKIAFTKAINESFLLVSIIGVIGIVLIFFWKEKPVHTRVHAGLSH